MSIESKVTLRHVVDLFNRELIRTVLFGGEGEAHQIAHLNILQNVFVLQTKTSPVPKTPDHSQSLSDHRFQVAPGRTEHTYAAKTSDIHIYPGYESLLLVSENLPQAILALLHGGRDLTIHPELPRVNEIKLLIPVAISQLQADGMEIGPNTRTVLQHTLHRGGWSDENDILYPELLVAVEQSETVATFKDRVDQLRLAGWAKGTHSWGNRLAMGDKTFTIIKRSLELLKKTKTSSNAK